MYYICSHDMNGKIFYKIINYSSHYSQAHARTVGYYVYGSSGGIIHRFYQVAIR
jgi:hypothetical protein